MRLKNKSDTFSSMVVVVDGKGGTGKSTLATDNPARRADVVVNSSEPFNIVAIVDALYVAV